MAKVFALLETNTDVLCVSVKTDCYEQAEKLLKANYKFNKILKMDKNKDNLEITNEGRATGYVSRPSYRNTKSSKRFFI